VRIHWGLLGWSNKRSGVEFYRWDEKIIPRHKSDWGDLLAEEDDIGQAEGHPVIVLILDRGASKEDLISATHAIQSALAALAPKEDAS
jgi:hypothetical protein